MTPDTRVVVPFKAWHFGAITRASPVSDGSKVGWLSPTQLEYMERGNSRTGFVDGEAIGCAGLVEQWPGRYVAWTYLRLDAGKHMRWVTREVCKGLNSQIGRLEMTVRADFPQGQRWAEMLGFHVEAPLLKEYGPEGEDHVGYVRFNRGTP